MTRTKEQIEAELAEADAKKAALQAELAKLDEPDWEAWRPAVEAWREARNLPLCAWYVDEKGNRTPGETFKDTVRGLIAAAPLMPVTAMTDAEIWTLGCELSASCSGENREQFTDAVIRATIARLGPVRKDWPSEAELREMARNCVREHVSRRHEAIEDYGEAIAIEMARRLKEYLND